MTDRNTVISAQELAQSALNGLLIISGFAALTSLYDLLFAKGALSIFLLSCFTITIILTVKLHIARKSAKRPTAKNAPAPRHFHVQYPWHPTSNT